MSLYRVIKKFLCTWLLQYRKLQVMFKMSPASLQTFIDTRPTLTPSDTPNSNYVITVRDWNFLKCFCVFCAVITRCTETFLSSCISGPRRFERTLSLYLQRVVAHADKENNYLRNYRKDRSRKGSLTNMKTYAPAAFTHRKHSWYSFLLEAESTSGP
jgi:hypothetical protein